MIGQFAPFFIEGKNPREFERQLIQTNAANQTTYNFTFNDPGYETGDQYAFCITGSASANNRALSSATIAGQAAVVVSGLVNFSSNSYVAAVAYRSAATTTGNFTVSCSFNSGMTAATLCGIRLRKFNTPLVGVYNASFPVASGTGNIDLNPVGNSLTVIPYCGTGNNALTSNTMDTGVSTAVENIGRSSVLFDNRFGPSGLVVADYDQGAFFGGIFTAVGFL